MPLNTARLKELVQELYRVVGELGKLAEGRHFTPDGHLVGSIGEVLAAHHFDLELLKASAVTHDAKQGEKLVQVKATQGKRISISSCPNYLLALKLLPDGTIEEIYNGPGQPVWKMVNHKKRPKNGQYPVSLAALTKLTKGEGYKPAFTRVR